MRSEISSMWQIQCELECRYWIYSSRNRHWCAILLVKCIIIHIHIHEYLFTSEQRVPHMASLNSYCHGVERSARLFFYLLRFRKCRSSFWTNSGNSGKSIDRFGRFDRSSISDQQVAPAGLEQEFDTIVLDYYYYYYYQQQQQYIYIYI